MGLFKSENELRGMGWIPQDEASELLGLPKGEMISWDYIESEQLGADRVNWVKLLPKYSVQGTASSIQKEGRPTPGHRRPTAANENPKSKIQNPKSHSPWVTVTEAMGILGVSRRTVYRLKREGTFWCLRDRWPRLLRRADVEKRAGENWYAERDAVMRQRQRPRMRPYRRDGVPLVSDEAFEVCQPYGFMAVE